MRAPPTPTSLPSAHVSDRATVLGRVSRSQASFISHDGTSKDFRRWNLKLMPILVCVSGPCILWPPLLGPCPPCFAPEPGGPVPLPSHYQCRPAGAARAPGGEAAGAEHNEAPAEKC